MKQYVVYVAYFNNDGDFLGSETNTHLTYEEALEEVAHAHELERMQKAKGYPDFDYFLVKYFEHTPEFDADFVSEFDEENDENYDLSKAKHINIL